MRKRKNPVQESNETPSLLDHTLAQAKRDAATVSSDGKRLSRLTEGVTFHDVPTHVDQRGSVVELYDPRWNWHPAPLIFAHCFTVRPGYVKGWGLHQTHEDRYFILSGELLLVLFDPRPGSSTYGEVCEIFLSEFNRRILNIPTHVWHAEQNIGPRDAVVIDFPTAPYIHDNPDKFRLPIDTPLIPYSFGDAKGW
jgi:dTDP-4-dehydrorhamnose 3,5-epimerase